MNDSSFEQLIKAGAAFHFIHGTVTEVETGSAGKVLYKASVSPSMRASFQFGLKIVSKNTTSNHHSIILRHVIIIYLS